jgi:RecB family exonuclease
VHERRGTPAADTPPLRFLFDVMAAAAEGMTRDAVLRLLESGYADRWAESRGKAGELRRVLGQVGVRGRTDARRRGPPGAALVEALDRFAGDAEAPRTLPLVRAAVSDFAERAAPLGQAGSIAEHVARVRRFVELCGLADAVARPASGPFRDSALGLRALIRESGDDAVAEVEARAFGRDQAALDALDVALDELDEAARRVGVDARLEAPSFSELLRDALFEHDVASGGLRGGAVRVVGLRDLAGLPVDAAFLVGLRDGELPAPPPDDPLLSTADRFAVARALSLRPDGPRHTFDVASDTRMGAVAFPTSREVEPLLFYLAAISPSTHLVLSRATTDDEGRPVIASQILDDALSALARAGVATRVESPAIDPAPPLGRAASVDEARRAWVRAFAEVGPTTSSAAAAVEDPSATLPEADPLGVRDLVERVVIERRRLATMLSIEQTEAAGPHSGQLDDGQRPEKVSASALEDLARCPFLYFAKRVLRIDADKAGGDDPDARQKGTVAHSCFQAAIEALRAAGFIPYDRARRGEALAVARTAAAAVAGPRFAALPIDAHLSTVVRDDTVDRVVSVVEALYDADDGYVPVAVEQAFGPPSAREGASDESRWPALLAAEVLLHGRIDLVERRGDAIRVTDLKSGDRVSLEKKLQPAELGWAELQLPIYAAAARTAMGAVAVDARYLSLRDGEPSMTVGEKRASGRNWKSDPRTEEDLFSLTTEDDRDTALGGRIRDLVDQATFGDFSVRPRKGACQHCDYAAVCRLPRGAPDAEDAT